MKPLHVKGKRRKGGQTAKKKVVTETNLRKKGFAVTVWHSSTGDGGAIRRLKKNRQNATRQPNGRRDWCIGRDGIHPPFFSCKCTPFLLGFARCRLLPVPAALPPPHCRRRTAAAGVQPPPQSSRPYFAPSQCELKKHGRAAAGLLWDKLYLPGLFWPCKSVIGYYFFP